MSFVLTFPELAGTVPSTALNIGLLNNLGDGGFERGERQIVDLLASVVCDHVVSLRLFTLPSIARGPKTKTRIAARYAPLEALLCSELDGLIVTGCEPQTTTLPREPFWHELTEVIDWAEHHTRSTVWSCLSAHAAVLHLDGIVRRKLPKKCSGIFDVERVAPHVLFDGASGDDRLPHSRWNTLDEDAITAAGYQILTRGDDVGVDTFVKQWRSLFVYLQGHPEYDPNALGREYRRDVDRYLAGASSIYPTMPANYFDVATIATLTEFEAKARADRMAVTPLGPLPPAVTSAPGPNSFPQILFRNWLGFLGAHAAGQSASAETTLRSKERPSR